MFCGDRKKITIDSRFFIWYYSVMLGTNFCFTMPGTTDVSKQVNEILNIESPGTADPNKPATTPEIDQQALVSYVEAEKRRQFYYGITAGVIGLTIVRMVFK